MKITIRYLKSYGTYAIFDGHKNKGSNSTTVEEAVNLAQKKFPGCTIVIKNFYKS